MGTSAPTDGQGGKIQRQKSCCTGRSTDALIQGDRSAFKRRKRSWEHPTTAGYEPSGAAAEKMTRLTTFLHVGSLANKQTSLPATRKKVA